MADHEAGEEGSVDKHDAELHGVSVFLGARGERRRGEEHALICLSTVEGANEGLDFRAANGVPVRVALGLHVDAGQAEGVLLEESWGVFAEAGVQFPADHFFILSICQWLLASGSYDVLSVSALPGIGLSASFTRPCGKLLS